MHINRAILFFMYAFLLSACSAFNDVENRDNYASVIVKEDAFIESKIVKIDFYEYKIKSEVISYSDDNPHEIPVKKVHSFDKLYAKKLIESLDSVDFHTMKKSYVNEATVDGVKLEIIINKTSGSNTVKLDNVITKNIYGLIDRINFSLDSEEKINIPLHFIEP